MRSLAARNNAAGTTNLRTHRCTTPYAESNPVTINNPTLCGSGSQSFE